MKFALINNEKAEATKGSKGVCPICGSELISKCGELKIHHWSHKGKRNCDPWWENETEWHRSWKEKFPVDWQEVIHYDQNGEKHIADIKTNNGWVIEFQHSFLNPEERRARNAFYGKPIWVVDGTRRKRDIEQFSKTLNSSKPFGSNVKVWRVHSDECVLLREWEDSNTPIFFDFGGDTLWWLLDGSSKGMVYVTSIPRIYFIEVHCVGEKQKIDAFNDFVKDVRNLIKGYESSRSQFRRM
ncbi:MAG: hypothetical protein CVV49_00520 [Spirochaetae bacterium HGW-Spirochaetae-5]|nr:MAG: hypothetical protein CVV49_00520 [Spirochaetae bacterium HGW-Spirochaetae-5]